MLTTMASYQTPYFDDTHTPIMRHERENLYKDRPVRLTAFTPRRVQKLTTKQHLPRSFTNIEINHKLRTFVSESVQPKPSASFKLWIEAGRRMPPLPPRWDPEYNSNIWKIFSSTQGFQVGPRSSVAEIVAKMYPVKIPPHSEMKDHTFSNFLCEIPLIKDQKKRHLAIARSQHELQEFKQLKLRSEMRVPPMSVDGDILPPCGFKKYAHKQFRTSSPQQTTSQSLRMMSVLEQDCERGLLGTHRSSPTRLWKLRFKDNHPDFDKFVANNGEKLHWTQNHLSVNNHQAEILFK